MLQIGAEGVVAGVGDTGAGAPVDFLTIVVQVAVGVAEASEAVVEASEVLAEEIPVAVAPAEVGKQEYS